MGPKSAGELRDRLKFQRRGTGDDGYGNETDAFADLNIERPAKVTATRGGEDVQAARLAGKASFDIWLHHDPALTAVKPHDRVVDVNDPARVFNIRFGPEDMDGDRRWLFIQAELGVPT